MGEVADFGKVRVDSPINPGDHRLVTQSTSDEWIGELITRRYEALGMTQADAARAAGLSDTTMREIERGDIRRRRPKTLHDVSVAMRWPPDALARMLSGEPAEEIGLPLGADLTASHGPPPWEELLAGQRRLSERLEQIAALLEREA